MLQLVFYSAGSRPLSLEMGKMRNLLLPGSSEDLKTLLVVLVEGGMWDMEGNIVMRIILFADPGETELRLWGKCLAPSVSHVLRQRGCCPDFMQRYLLLQKGLCQHPDDILRHPMALSCPAVTVKP